MGRQPGARARPPRRGRGAGAGRARRRALPDAGQGELQSGTFDITGDYSWSGNFGQADGDWSFTVSTPTPLHYNESCDTDPELDGGQVRAAINGRNNIGFTVDYGPGCGQETVNTFDTNAT